MSKMELSQDELFLKNIKEQNFSSDGHFDLYLFCFVLAECLVRDKKVEERNPNPVGELFMQVACKDESDYDGFSKVHRPDIPKNDYSIYPSGEFISVHVKVFANSFHEFIFKLGQDVLCEEPKLKPAYFAFWLNSEDVFTYTLLDKIFQEISNFIINIKDKMSFRRSMERLHLNEAFDASIVNSVEIKGETSRVARERIVDAIKAGYYLESLALQESYISDRLSMFLFHKQTLYLKNTSLFDLINKTETISPCDLFDELQTWRTQRNKAIHGFVRSSPYEHQVSIEEFDLAARKAAEKGWGLIEEFDKWFDDCLFDMINPYRILPNDVFLNTRKELN